MARAELLALADRCDVRDRKLRSIIEGGNMSADSQAIAISMLVTLDLNIFRDVAAALRQAANGSVGDAEALADEPRMTAGAVVVGEAVLNDVARSIMLTRVKWGWTFGKRPKVMAIDLLMAEAAIAALANPTKGERKGE